MASPLSMTPPKITEPKISTSPPAMTSDPRVQYENLKKKYLLSLGVTKPVTLGRNPRIGAQPDSDISLLAQSLPAIPTQLKLQKEAAPSKTVYGFDDNLASSPLSSAPPSAEDSLNFAEAEILPRKARAATINTISIPIHPSNVPAAGPRVEQEKDEQEDQDESELSNNSEQDDSDDLVNTLEWDDLPNNLPKQKNAVVKKKSRDEKFIPPHELLAKKTSGSFSVGTARDVAIWEQRRRNMMDTT